MVKKIIFWCLVLGWMGVIFSFSGQNSEASVELSDGILMDILNFLNINLTEEALVFFSVFIRKVAHFTIYAILGALICILMREGYSLKGKKCFFVPFLVSGIYAFTDEFHQLFISGRSGEIKDVLIDSSGAAFGTGVMLLLFWILKRRRKNG